MGFDRCSSVICFTTLRILAIFYLNDGHRLEIQNYTQVLLSKIFFSLGEESALHLTSIALGVERPLIIILV